MTNEERFERIETDLAGTTGILRKVAEIQERQAESLIQIAESLSKYIDQSDARTQEWDGRMRRIEENLDGLIRALTVEHGNGKK
jgi:hypothetical protein